MLPLPLWTLFHAKVCSHHSLHFNLCWPSDGFHPLKESERLREAIEGWKIVSSVMSRLYLRLISMQQCKTRDFDSKIVKQNDQSRKLFVHFCKPLCRKYLFVFFPPLFCYFHLRWRSRGRFGTPSGFSVYLSPVISMTLVNATRPSRNGINRATTDKEGRKGGRKKQRDTRDGSSRERSSLGGRVATGNPLVRSGKA